MTPIKDHGYLAENGVWLTEYVAAKYLRELAT